MMQLISQNVLPIPITTGTSALACLKQPYLNLLSILGYAEDNLPYAQLLAQYHHLSGDWLIVSPICWEASHNDVVLVAEGSTLGLTEHEGRRYFKALEAYFKEDGLVLYWHDASTWLLQRTAQAALIAPPVTHLPQQSLMSVIARLDTSHQWQRILTEVQMLFANFHFESQRSSMPVNGIWIWGGGALGPKHHVCIKTDDKQALPCLSLLSDQVEIYHGLEDVEDNDLVLLMNTTVVDWAELNKLRQKMAIRYYGPESAYLYPKLSILDRLFKRY